MSKFKVGDRVRVTYSATYWCGEGDVTVANGDTYNVRYDDGKVGGFHERNLELLEHSSPIRTVTRREIVPGEYGGVTVEGVDAPWRKVRYEGFIEAQPLRDAARIFNEIADVLDEQKGAA